VRLAIKKVLESEGKRVAISAFVGRGAEAFLPNPKGMTLICWPKDGNSTNPTVLRRIKQRGAKVFFADRLHMKLYWAPTGAVITSANLSTGALGKGGLKEVGVHMPAGAVDIKRVIESLSMRPFNKKDMARLDRTQCASARHHPEHKKVCTFRQWLDLPSRPEWRLALVTGTCECSESAKRYTQLTHQRHEPSDFLGTGAATDYSEGDRVLCLTWNGGTDKPTQCSWMWVDRVVSVSKRDHAAYDPETPYQALQVSSSVHYPPPPFSLDSKIKAAIRKAVVAYGFNKATWTVRVPPALIALIAKHYH
jgi:hypothetical protein